MLRKFTPLALAAGILCTTPALALPVLYGGNTSGRFFSVDDLSDGNPMTSISTGGYDMAGLAYDFDSGSGLYGGNDTRFFSIDVHTGAQTVIDGSVDYDIQALVFGPGGVLFGGNGSRFYSVDPTTGAMTNIKNNVDYGIRGLAYDRQAGILYGTGGTLNRFYTIDPITGNQTLINGNTAGLNDIAIHQLTGVMYGGSNPLIGSGNWYTIDKATGVATLASGSPSFSTNSLAFIPEPGTAVLLAAGILGLGMAGRKRA